MARGATKVPEVKTLSSKKMKKVAEDAINTGKRCSNFFTQNFISGSFAPLIAYSNFIESLEQGTIEFCLIKSVTALLRNFISTKKHPFYK